MSKTVCFTLCLLCCILLCLSQVLSIHWFKLPVFQSATPLPSPILLHWTLTTFITAPAFLMISVLPLPLAPPPKPPPPPPLLSFLYYYHFYLFYFIIIIFRIVLSVTSYNFIQPSSKGHSAVESGFFRALSVFGSKWSPPNYTMHTNWNMRRLFRVHYGLLLIFWSTMHTNGSNEASRNPHNVLNLEVTFQESKDRKEKFTH